MCKLMEKYFKEERQQELQQERIRAIQTLIKKGNDKEFILDLDYTEEEYQEAEASLLERV